MVRSHMTPELIKQLASQLRLSFQTGKTNCSQFSERLGKLVIVFWLVGLKSHVMAPSLREFLPWDNPGLCLPHFLFLVKAMRDNEIHATLTAPPPPPTPQNPLIRQSEETQGERAAWSCLRKSTLLGCDGRIQEELDKKHVVTATVRLLMFWCGFECGVGRHRIVPEEKR